VILDFNNDNDNDNDICVFHFRYQKTTEAVKAASEKTTSMFGSLGGSVARKLGEVKNSNAFKSFEERVGYAVTNVKVQLYLLYLFGPN